MYGRYIPDEFIPLGIRVRVEAIYEPPQQNDKDVAVVELNDSEEERVNSIAAMFGLQKVGFIWTDLKIDPQTRKNIKSRDQILTSEGTIDLSEPKHINHIHIRKTK